jgi:hypothetical protein
VLKVIFPAVGNGDGLRLFDCGRIDETKLDGFAAIELSKVVHRVVVVASRERVFAKAWIGCPAVGVVDAVAAEESPVEELKDDSRILRPSAHQVCS